ncbi:methyltransferase domain-containing protein [Actinomyces sp. B33]|uniref:methyltransferase domain-containing protein n=1 Tax=Actinomyces sp. B33 TaxID=2942131 RepID=UPI00234062F1|nr:methyltransferase domain-containing protein [Actinomyces sp. B33]MDC4232268.1 methyltransferase domain-containing protein [Actinomyces sp. B33]
MHCEHWDRRACPSCTRIDTPYPDQLAAKQARVAALLDPLGSDGIHWLPACPSAQTGFRTSAKLVVGGTRRRPTLGILGADRRGVDLPGCPIQHPAINAAAPGLKRLIRAARLDPYDVPTRRGELKSVLITVGADERLMLRFVLRSREKVPDLRRALPLLRDLVPAADIVTANIHPAHEAVLEGPDEIVLTSRRTLPLNVGDARLMLGPGSFAQTNTRVASALYRQAAAWAALPLGASERAPRTLWDLYCGVGGFALHAAGAGLEEVTGVEVSESAIASAIAAAKNLGLPRSRARFIAADATAWARDQDPRSAPDVLVVNPPRRGIGADLAGWIDRSGIPRVVYSSCNPQTLARDLESMGAYAIRAARVFDMFPHTNHVEAACLLEHR